MRIVGISGGLNTIHGGGLISPAHNSAAVLLENGVILEGSEEERLLRIKNSGHLPMYALRQCLAARGLKGGDIDAFAVFASEGFALKILQYNLLDRPHLRMEPTPRLLLARILGQVLRCEIDPARIHFVDHHTTHAYSAYYLSGFERALVYTTDGEGDGVSSRVFSVQGDEWQALGATSVKNSLGSLYLETIKHLGYSIHEEYKVMGLAPYGDPSVYRSVFERLYELGENGQHELHLERVHDLFAIAAPRRKGDEFTVTHRNIAASLQEALERLVAHALEHYRKLTGQKNLCLSGGVAQNSTNNGKLYYSGLFERVFVDPAAHDAGCAVGAALYVHKQLQPEQRTESLKAAYFGTALPPSEEVGRTLERWAPLVSFEKPSDIVERAAALLAAGDVVGWVQGRAEFGPRALGNRSILADPRPEANRARINQMIKKREGYRPFAPTVQAEVASRYFEIPREGTDFSTMSYVLKVKPDQQAALGAVTHIDGTARVQTVTSEQNPRFYDLLGAFAKHTGVPMLLNTSFNNHVEPIVDDLHDALTCYLTTGLDWLVVDGFLVKRRESLESGIGKMSLALERYCSVRQTHEYAAPERLHCVHEIHDLRPSPGSSPISALFYRLLTRQESTPSIADFVQNEQLSKADTAALMQEILNAWDLRQIRLQPPKDGAAELTAFRR